MLRRPQMSVCGLLMCVCVCVSSSRISVLCSEERVCRDIISQEVLQNCLRACAEQQGLDSASPVEHQGSALAPPPTRWEEEEEEEERSVALGVLLTLLSPPPGLRPDEAHSAERRAYSMEHFRWGKPAGRKRRPVKVYTSAGVSGGVGEGADNRRALATQEEEEEEEEEEQKREMREGEAPTKLTYRMKHFRWSHPPPQADKRYGGFMKPWAASSQLSHKPLLKLLRHAIARDGH
ncbi:pro-opiomelanocortin-2-like [Alosa sapidissima]|uniref:pro-opiomelanocortin-2-like n=1 Tax=Alosa sapidissima TaxID=34773 RepID=UPI001C09AB58|nr:pro-opiomelanocortin-2-like [Alosa sapidissima]